MSAIAPIRVSNRHNSIIDYLIANPAAKLRSVALTFGLTQSWLSVLIHSSAFKAKLAARQDLVFNEEVCATVEERLMGVASIATDRLLELVPRETDVKVIADTMDKTLKNLGYGQRTAGTHVHQNNTLVLGGAVDARTINRARAMVGASQGEELVPLEGEILESEPVGGTDLPEVRASGDSSLGAFDSLTSIFPELSFEKPAVPEGAEVRGGGAVEAPAKI